MPESSRFVLSRNANPLQDPIIQISNPDNDIQINTLNAGIYYWTIEAVSYDGLVSIAPPGQLIVQSIQALSAPVNMVPANMTRIDIDALRSAQFINFSWNAVSGANAYIFNLFEQTAAGRRQIIRGQPENRTNRRLEDLSILSQGTFVWQIEAVNIGTNGTIEQRGSVSERIFIIDIPLPAVQAIRPGVLYGQ